MRVIDAGNRDRRSSRHGPFSVKAGHRVLPEITPPKLSLGYFVNTVPYLLRGILCVLSVSGIFLSIALVPHKPTGFQRYSTGTFQCSNNFIAVIFKCDFHNIPLIWLVMIAAAVCPASSFNSLAALRNGSHSCIYASPLIVT